MWLKRRQAAREIIKVCRRLHLSGHLSGADGNVSLRLPEGLIMITPSGRAKSELKESEMVLLDFQGQSLRGGAPSSEKLLHLEIYRQAPRARAVIHAHSPSAIAWSVAKPESTELPAAALSELIPATGGVPVVPYARPGSAAMAAAVRPFLPKYQALILARHGALAWGVDLAEAVRGIERIEHAAKVLGTAQAMGGISLLPPAEVAALWELRRTMGERLL